MAVFTVNGQKVEPTGNQKLLRFLRDELHLTSVRTAAVKEPAEPVQL